MKKLLFLFLSAPLFLQAQETTGIQWANGLTWQQVKQKAKTENKYIFIDAYATWCVPCKQMDKEVYPQEEVGNVFNKKFISIKVQADQNPADKEDVRKWYEDAAKIAADYRVGAYPTFLFLSPDGELVHRFSGGVSVANFLSIADDALEGRGYATLLNKFMKGDYEGLDLKELARSAKYSRDDSLAKVIAAVFVKNTDVEELIKQENMLVIFELGQDDNKWAREICMPKISTLSIKQLANPVAIRFLLYAAKNDSLVAAATDKWMEGLSGKYLFDKDTLNYIKTFMRNSKDKAFSFLRNNQSRIDKIMGEKNWAQWDIDNVINKEEFLEPIILPAYTKMKAGTPASTLTEPNWDKLQMTITNKYGKASAERFSYRTKVDWYRMVDNKKEYIKNLVAEMDRTSGFNLDGMSLNNNCMEVFRYSTNKKELETAANWMKKFYQKNKKEFETDAGGIDTYAILLYKAGVTEEAIKLEEKAHAIDPNDGGISSNLAKMKAGNKIWPQGYDVIN